MTASGAQTLAQPPSPVYSPEQLSSPHAGTAAPAAANAAGADSVMSDETDVPGSPTHEALHLLQQMADASASGDSAAALAAAAAALAAHGMTAAPAAAPAVAPVVPPPPAQPAVAWRSVRIARKPNQPNVPSHMPMNVPMPLCSSAATAASASAPAPASAAPPNAAGAAAPSVSSAPPVVQQQPTFAAVAAVSADPSAHTPAVPPAGAPAVAPAGGAVPVNEAHPAVCMMMEDGLTAAEAIAIVNESMNEDAAGFSIAPLALVPANEQAFDLKIFEETLRADVTSTLLRLGGLAGLATNEDSVKIGIFQQLDVNSQAKSVLSVECGTPEWGGFVLAAQFVVADIPFKAIPLEEWLGTVSAIPYFGKRYGVVFGPFPFTPTWDHIKRYAPLMSHYGTPLNCIVYQNRKVTISFALGDKPIPEYRRRISIVLNGKYMGVIHAVHGIKILGIPSCQFCPAIGEAACTPESTRNKDNPLFQKAAHKIAAAAAARHAALPDGAPPSALGDGYGGGAGAKERSRERRTLMQGKELSRTSTGVPMT